MRALWILSAIVAVAFAAALGVWSYAAIPFVDDVPAAATRVIAALVVITVIVERSLAAINAGVFGPSRASQIAKLRDLEIKKDLGAMAAPAIAEAAEQPRAAIVAIGIREEQARLAIGYLLAFLISAAGVRTLSALLRIDGAGGLPEGMQKSLVHALDIIVTAGLIAGGSNGLAQLLQAIRNGLKPPPALL